MRSKTYLSILCACSLGQSDYYSKCILPDFQFSQNAMEFLVFLQDFWNPILKFTPSIWLFGCSNWIFHSIFILFNSVYSPLPLRAAGVQSCPWTRPTSYIFILHRRQITEDNLQLNCPPYRRGKKNFSPAKHERLFTHSPRTAGKADKLCWCEVAVGGSWGCGHTLLSSWTQFWPLRERVGE